MYFPDVVENMNTKVFHLISRTNETRYIKLHETCKYKCRLDASVHSNKQCWNEYKCRCECKELIVKGSFDKRFIWNLSNCECQCDKSCDVGEYLCYEYCKWREKLVDKLINWQVQECTENIDEVKLGKINVVEHENICLYTLICIILSICCNKQWNWYVFCLLQIHEPW